MVKKIKQYILIRKDLKDIPLGKIMAHCGHAPLTAIEIYKKRKNYETNEMYNHRMTRFYDWYENNQTKIVKSINTLIKLENIIEKVKARNLPYVMLKDVSMDIYILAAVGPITDQEAKELRIWRLSNFK